MQSTLSYAVLVLCVGFVAAEVYSDCGSKLATVENVQVSGCDGTQEECILKRNTNVTISMDIIPNVPLTKVNTVVHGVMMGMPVPFPLSNPNACEGTGLTCPLNQKEKYSYSAIMPVLKAYPKVNVDVKWELQNEDNIDIACLLIPAKIQ